MSGLQPATKTDLLRYSSVCSGIEAVTVAWHSLGFEPAWFSEIEQFPSAVLAHHYPNVPNLGDMRQIGRRILSGSVEAPDILVGGTPCQAFSVAGLRDGLNDDRGQLTISYVRLADAADFVRRRAGKPETIIVWENVPGVLSDKTNAFGCFLGGLAGEDCELVPPGKRWADAGCVYGPKRAIAWRILDAQYFGLAQRRRRVFVVASARKGFDPAAVLFEFDGVRRDSPPRREAGKDVTAGTARSVALRGRDGGATAELGDECAGTLRASGGGGDKPYALIASTGDISHCLNAGGMGRQDFETETVIVQCVHGTQNPCVDDHTAFALGRNSGQENVLCLTGDVTHTLKAEGFDASEDGTGRGQPIVATTGGSYGSTKEADTIEALRALREAVGAEAFTQWGLGVLDSLQSPQVLRQDLHGCGVRCETCEGEPRLDDGASSCSQAGPAWPLCEMREAGRQRRAPQGRRLAEQLARELGAYLSELPHQRAQTEGFLQSMWQASEGLGLLRQALPALQEMGRSPADEGQPAQRAAVRRLTPRETERLQGFHDGYTLVPYRNKEAADGPRYKALGNSMAVPVMRWIGSRIKNELSRNASL